MPTLATTLAVFVLMVVLIRRGFLLGTAFFCGGLLLVLAPGGGPSALLPRLLLRTLGGEDFWTLLAMVLSITLLSGLMRDAGRMRALVDGFARRVRSRRAPYVFFPAVVGLLPMPGGALFSCPMVAEAATGVEPAEAPLELAARNYWFRHVWEFSWPLYPGLFLVYSLVPDLNFLQFLLLQFPLCLLALAAGRLTLLRHRPGNRLPPAIEGDRPGLLSGLGPILVIPLVYLLLSLAGSQGYNFGLPGKARVVPGVLLAILLVLASPQLPVGSLKRLLFSRESARMAWMVFGITAFSTLMQGSGTAARLAAEFAASGVPLSLVIVLLPFLAGLVSGITVAFIGSSFPILISLLQAGDSPVPLAAIILAFSAGFLGVMLSPVHLCLVLTAEYFRVGVGAVLRRILPPALLLAAGAWAWSLVLLRSMP